MLDLFRARDKAMRYVLIVLLSLVAISMVVTLIPGFGSGGMVNQREDVLAEVCGDRVTSRMVAQVAAAQMRERQFSSSMAEFMIPQMVNQFVGELATSCAALRLGLTASDDEVAKYIQVRMPMLFENGGFVGAEAYQSYLANMGTTIPEFEKRVRQQILLDKLQRVAFDSIIVTPKEVEDEFSRKAERVRLDVLKFDPIEYQKTFKPTRDELEAYIKANQATYQIPVQRTASVVVADADKLGEALKITDAQIKSLYDSRVAGYRQEEKVRARHILIKVDEKAPKEDKDKARAKAQGILDKIKAGAKFDELAKQFSEDTGTKDKGGDLDFFQRGQMVKPFDDAAFRLKKNELSGLVETVFGFHIIQATDRQEARVKTLDEVREELVSEIRKQQMFDRMPGLTEQARAGVLASPGQAEAVAKKHGLLFARAEKVSQGSPFPLVGPHPDLEQQLSTMKAGEVSPVMQTRDNKLFFFVLDEILPSRPAKLSEVESQVRDGYLSRKGYEKAEEMAKQFDEKLKANGGDFKKTAAAMGLKVIDTGEFARGGQMKDVGPAGYFGDQPFLNAQGANVGIFRVGNNPYYFRVAAKIPADLSMINTDRQNLVSAIRERKLRERREMFEEGLIESLKGTGKLTVRDDLVKRLAQSYGNRG
jgi:peptidyl-prolyl cis-trans isomerase D